MCPYLHNNINKKTIYGQPRTYRASLLLRGSSLRNMAAEGQSGGGHRGFHGNSLGVGKKKGVEWG